MIVFARFSLTECCKKMYALFLNSKYGISIIYALLTRNFVVRIYALFPQIFLDWKAKSADIFTFWMYGFHPKQELDKYWVHFQNGSFTSIDLFTTNGTAVIDMKQVEFNPHLGWSDWQQAINWKVGSNQHQANCSVQATDKNGPASYEPRLPGIHI